MGEQELKMSILWHIAECLLAINCHKTGPAAEFGEWNKTVQSILTGKDFSVSMWLCWGFNTVSANLKPMGCEKLSIICVYVNLQYINRNGLVLPRSEPCKTCLAPLVVHQRSRSPNSLPEQARTNKLRRHRREENWDSRGFLIKLF